MADFPQQGGSEGTWGTELINFFKEAFHMSDIFGGELAIVCNQGQVVTNQNQVLTNIDRSL